MRHNIDSIYYDRYCDLVSIMATLKRLGFLRDSPVMRSGYEEFTVGYHTYVANSYIIQYGVL